MDCPYYDPQRGTDAPTDDELDPLDEQLRALPSDSVTRVEALDGYITALVVGPPGAGCAAHGRRAAHGVGSRWRGHGTLRQRQAEDSR